MPPIITTFFDRDFFVRAGSAPRLFENHDRRALYPGMLPPANHERAEFSFVVPGWEIARFLGEGFDLAA